MRIYLSGPLFTQVERQWNRRLATALEKHIPDTEVFLPQDIKFEGAYNRPEHYQHIYDRCLEMVEEADMMVAVLDGADADSGTAYEMGYARALGVPIIGVRTDYRKSQERGLNLMLARGCDELLREMSFSEDTEQLARDLVGKIAAAIRRLDVSPGR